MPYLVDNPPRHQQYRCPRRERPSGVVGLHTAESFPDETGPDTGAENVARFIRDRTNYGSYHDLADSDSIIQLVDYGCVAYHIATYGLNEHSYGVSAATQAHRWDELDPQWVDDTVRNMARASARYARWIEQHYGVRIPARRISLAQARRKIPGFIAHGDADPERRTDPGDGFPWGRFLDYYADEMGDDMPLNEEDLTRIADRVQSVLRFPQIVSNPGGQDRSMTHASSLTMRGTLGNADRLARVLANQQAIMAAQGVDVDEAALAAQISAVLVPAVVAEVSGATEAETEQVMERVLRRVLGSLDA